MTRSEVRDAKRVVVKVGSSSLTTAAGGIDPDRVSRLVDVLAGVRARGTEVVLVSSGAIAAGLAPLGLSARPKALAAQQAAASVGQGLLVHRYTEELARHGLVAGQVLLTVDDVARRAHYRNATQTLTTLLEMGVLPIVNENDTVATSEIRFGDNDRLAALVAHLVNADLLVLLSDIDGLYTAPPSTPGAARIDEVADIDALEVEMGSIGTAGVGTGGMVTKLDAARIASSSGTPVVLASAADAAAALAGTPVGTFFHAAGRRRPRRLLWLAHATETTGTVMVDAGAARALVERGASLLAAGLTGVRGTFVAGDPIAVESPDGAVIARGLVNYDSEELATLAGSKGVREVVHRDDLILLSHR